MSDLSTVNENELSDAEKKRELMKQKEREYSRRYYQTHKEKCKAYAKMYHATHKEQRSKWIREYYRKNREKILAKERAYRQQKKLENSSLPIDDTEPQKYSRGKKQRCNLDCFNCIFQDCILLFVSCFSFLLHVINPFTANIV